MLTLIACVVLWLSASAAQQDARELILVSFSGEDAVGLIDPRTGEVLEKLAVATNPHEIALTQDRRRAYVATTGGQPGTQPPKTPNVIAALDLQPRRPAVSIDIGAFQTPHDVRVSADGNIVWIACAPGQAVVEIDSRTGRQITVWRTGADGGWFLAVTPDGNKIYVPHLEGKRVSVIDRGRRSVSTVVEGGAQSGIDISPDGRQVWVIDHEQRTIQVIDSVADRVIARVPLASNEFGRLRFTPDGTKVVIVQGRSIALFDPQTRQNAGEIALPFPGKVVDVSPAGDRAAVSHPAENRLSIVDLAKRTVTASIPTGRTPDGVAWVR